MMAAQSTPNHTQARVYNVQFLIDTDTESREGLLMASQVMALLARGLTDEEIQDAAAPRRAPKPAVVPPPVGKPAAPAPVAPLPPNSAPPPPVIHPPVHPDALPKDDVPAGTDIDPAALFGGNRAPLAPPAPGVATAPAAPVANVAGVPAAAAGTANAPTSATVTVPASGERDSEGLPWDARIHSETKKTNADGTWRYRRNLDAAVKAAVYAELKAAAGQQVIPSQPVAVVTNAVPVSAPAAPLPVAPPAPTSVSAPPPPAAGDVSGVAPPPPGTTAVAAVAPPPPASATVLPFPAAAAPPVPVQSATDVGVSNAGNPPVVQAAVTSFRDLMQKVNMALAAGRLTQPQLAEACKLAGVDSVAALAAQPMLVPSVDTNLNRWLAA